MKLFVKHLTQYFEIDWNTMLQHVLRNVKFDSPCDPLHYEITCIDRKMDFIKLVLTNNYYPKIPNDYEHNSKFQELTFYKSPVCFKVALFHAHFNDIKIVTSSPFVGACVKGGIETLKLFLRYPPKLFDINQKDRDGNSALH